MKLNKKLFFSIIFILITAALPASAALPTLVPKCASQVTTGAPPLSCALELGVNITNWILGITGSLAILYFVFGGLMMMTSRGAGTKEWGLERSKEILTQAVIGIIIIFGAYVGVKFIVSALGAIDENKKSLFKTEFEIQKPIDGNVPEQNPTPTKENAYQCECSYEKIDLQTKTFKTAADATKQYSSSEDCIKNCNNLCKTTNIPNVNPPGKYTSGSCKSLN